LAKSPSAFSGAFADCRADQQGRAIAPARLKLATPSSSLQCSRKRGEALLHIVFHQHTIPREKTTGVC